MVQRKRSRSLKEGGTEGCSGQNLLQWCSSLATRAHWKRLAPPPFCVGKRVVVGLDSSPPGSKSGSVFVLARSFPVSGACTAIFCAKRGCLQLTWQLLHPHDVGSSLTVTQALNHLTSGAVAQSSGHSVESHRTRAELGGLRSPDLGSAVRRQQEELRPGPVTSLRPTTTKPAPD
jgi:hypothetical protein